jgi:hypothetical protein
MQNQQEFNKNTAKFIEEIINNITVEINRYDWEDYSKDLRPDIISEIIDAYSEYPKGSSGNDEITECCLQIFKNIIFPENIEKKLLAQENYELLGSIKKEYIDKNIERYKNIVIEEALSFTIQISKNLSSVFDDVILNRKILMIINEFGFRQDTNVVDSDNEIWYGSTGLLNFILRGIKLYRLVDNFNKESPLKNETSQIYMTISRLFIKSPQYSELKNQLLSITDGREKIEKIFEYTNELFSKYVIYYLTIIRDDEIENNSRFELALNIIWNLRYDKVIDLYDEFNEFFGFEDNEKYGN